MGAFEVRRKEPDKDKTDKVNKLQKKWKKYQVGDEVVQEVHKLSQELIVVRENLKSSQGKKEESQSVRNELTEIEKKLKKIAEENKLDYPMVIKEFLHFLREEDQKIAFEFFPDDALKEIRPKVYFPMQIMKFEGIYDIPRIDIEQLFEKNSFTRVENIYFRAKTDLPLLIVGETGTSKGLMALAIHKTSKRSKKPFLSINCAAIPESLIASELFGHLKGAFTGAVRDKKGVFEQADEGTLFLDELGKMPRHLQANLLKVIEDQKFQPVGGIKSIDIDVRILASAHPSDLPEFESENILPDLLYRLGCPDIIEMPTLNQRVREIGLDNRNKILEKSVRRVLENLEIDKIKISEKATGKLFNYHYKGNYREFENILRSSILSAIINRRETVKLKDLNLDKVSSQLIKPEDLDFGVRSRENLKNVALKDIINFANDVRASIVEEKIKDVLSEEGDVSRVLLKEGFTKNQYRNFWRKITTIMGKKLNDFNSSDKKPS